TSSPLISFTILGGSVGKFGRTAVKTAGKLLTPVRGRRTRLRAFSLQRAEQYRCWRARRAVERPQLAHFTGASRRKAKLARRSSSGSGGLMLLLTIVGNVFERQTAAITA